MRRIKNGYGELNEVRQAELRVENLRIEKRNYTRLAVYIAWLLILFKSAINDL